MEPAVLTEELAMPAAPAPGRDHDAERDLVGELAHAVVQRVAPEELVLFGETEADYFRDPGSLRADSRDEAVGFGLDLALLTPYVLLTGTAVVRFLASVLSDTVHDELKDKLRPVVAAPLRRLLRRDEPAAAGDPGRPLGLTAAQAREVRRVALQEATRSGLDEAKSALLADAFVGALLVDG
jgi:hypothetical protein